MNICSIICIMTQFQWLSVRKMSEPCQAKHVIRDYNDSNMNIKDKKYLRIIGKMRPSLGVFERMVRILKDEHNEIDKLFKVVDATLLKDYEAA